MHADICDPSDDKAIEKFRATLRRFGAQLEDKSWAIGVDLYKVKIGNEELAIFCDEHSLDIEGSESLVQKVLRDFKLS